MDTARPVARAHALTWMLAVPCILGTLAAFVPDVTGLTATRQTPGSVFAGRGEISGVVFLDANASRTADAGEDGVAGMSVVLMTRWGGLPLAVFDTAADGRFTFDRVVPGAYRLTLQIPQGTTPTNDASPIVSLSAADGVARYDFGIVMD